MKIIRYLFVFLILLVSNDLYAQKISDLPATTSATNDDTLIINDADTTTKKITVGNFWISILAFGGSPTGTWDWTGATVTWPTFNQNTSGNAATATLATTATNATTAATATLATAATALAANGANCSAGSYPLGVDASGAAESCTAAPTATSLHVDDILTALGIASGATHMGTFTGATITDNVTAKAALQELETAIETLPGGHDVVSLNANLTDIFSLSTQELLLDTQTANTVFAGPTTGAAAIPAFRALVSADIPSNAASTSSSAGSVKSPSTSGVSTITGPAAGTTRVKTVRDANDTVLELGGSYTPTGTWNFSSLTGTWPTFNQSTTGTAATVVVVDTNDTTAYVALFDSVSGNLAAKTDPGLTYDASTGTLTATAFSGPLTGSARSLKSPDTTGVTTITGPGTGTTRVKTVRNADDTILEQGGDYTPTGAWSWSSANVTWSADLAPWAAITPPTLAAEVAIITGTSATAMSKLAITGNNKVVGTNSAGTLGVYDVSGAVLNPSPTSDDTSSGTYITLTAGEALAQWDVVYCKNKAGVHACYKYDADGADKLLLPQYIATTAVSADAAGVFLVTGVVRNDGWSQTTNQDEGKPVFASTTAGGITLTEPVTAASEKVVVGYVLEENKIRFIQPRHYPILTSSFVIPAPAATDDINIMKAPRALNILSSGISCIVQGTTSVTGQLQECDATGGSCADLDSDIVCDADGAVDDGSLTDSSIASGAWLRWKTTSVSGTPTFLTVTFQYRTAGE